MNVRSSYRLHADTEELDTRKHRPLVVAAWFTDRKRSGGWIMRQAGLFGLSGHWEWLCRHGDPLEVLDTTVDFEHFRGWLVEEPDHGDGAKGGRPPFDPVSMVEALILQAQHDPGDARTEVLIRDRRSWMRFPGFDPGGPTPDENTIRHVRNRRTETGPSSG